MFSFQMPYGMDPWASDNPQPDRQYQISRRAAERFSVMQAIRERRDASRSARQTPEPARADAVAAEPRLARSKQRRAEDLTPIG
jgi:hypothetical protein